jgi:LCP family protein required for cell wall assembly
MNYHTRNTSEPENTGVKSTSITEQKQALHEPANSRQEIPNWLNYEATAHQTKPKSLSHTFVKPWHFKKAGFLSLLAVSVVFGVFLFRVSLTSCKVVECSTGTSALALQEETDPTQLRGEGDGRVNILLIGIGGDKHISGDLSDSIVIISVNPIDKEAAILSIPRDLYLEIPGYGSARINAAHAYGEQEEYPGGGPALLKKTVSETFGIPIHYYVRADFEGFRKAINIVGGVDVEVEEAIYDVAYPGQRSSYQPFILEAGQQHLDGETALKYARSRQTSSDFDRSKRQQKILLALKDKALSLSTVTNPVKVNSLLQSVGSNIKTDLNINEIIKLTTLAKEVDSSKILSVGLDNAPGNYLASANISGASVLVPTSGSFSEIKLYIRNILIDGFIKNEKAPVIVLNGTTKPQLANQTASLLRSYGYNVVKVGDATKKDYSQNEIIDGTQGEKPYTLRYLEQRFNTKPQTSGESQQGAITIIVGSEYNP